MIRVVVDTNVRFSAVLTPHGTAATCIHVLRNSQTVLISRVLLEEFERTLKRKLKFTEAEISPMLLALEAESDLITTSSLIESVSRDPDDDHVLHCAVSGKADFIVTGDSDLLVLHEHRGIRIFTPVQMLAFLRDPATQPEVRPAHPPVVPIPQEPFVPKRRLQRLVSMFPAGQFVRYLCVGVFNSIFGYSTYALALFLLNHLVPQRFLSLTVMAASITSTPINITVAYFGYKLFVFRTRGNYLLEWFKCFGVYGVGMLPGLLALSAITRLLQTLFHAHGPALHADVDRLAAHLSGAPLAALHKIASGKAAAGYIAGALVQGFTTVFSFVGHKKVTFKQRAERGATRKTAIS